MGIARELSAIYDLPLKEIEKVTLPSGLKEYNIEIQNTDKIIS